MKRKLSAINVSPPSLRLCAFAFQKSRRGATLLVTLGILTVISILAVSFLTVSRIQRQTAAASQHRDTARNHLNAALHLAMSLVDESMTYPNYSGDFKVDEEAAFNVFDNRRNQQRMAPIAQWFTGEYCATNRIDTNNVVFQTGNMLVSPTFLGTTNAHVNLLTPQVLRLLPSILTNGLPQNEPLLMSGWHDVGPVPGGDTQTQLLAPLSRVAFAVINCSSLFDANHFEGRPTGTKRATHSFSQTDAANWAEHTDQACFTNLKNLVDWRLPEESPFGFLSYDPGPDVSPLYHNSFETTPALGFHRFNAGPVIDLNNPGIRREDGANGKFNINSITNNEWGCQIRDAGGGLSGTDGSPWYNNASFRSEWLDPVTTLLRQSLNGEALHDPRRIPGYHRDGENIEPYSPFAWSVANQIDAGRVPRVSDFPTDDKPEPDIYSRADYAVKPVPLINKVHVFNIFAEKDGGEKPPKDYTYYDGLDSSLSNHYAVAIELWYPFAPHEPPEDTWCYVGVVTNEMDALTMTNRPWTAGELEAWLSWNDAGRSNTIMQLLFKNWSLQYRTSIVSNRFLTVNPSNPTVGFDNIPRRSWEQRLEDHPLWQTVTTDKDLWFTSGMTTHPSWPGEAGTNGVDIYSTPIGQAFYPGLATNAAGDVYVEGLAVTNYFIALLFEPDYDTTNRLSSVTGGNYPWNRPPYMPEDHYIPENQPLSRLTWDTGIGTDLVRVSSGAINIPFGLVRDAGEQKEYYNNLISISMEYGGDAVSVIVNHVTTELTPYTLTEDAFGYEYWNWGSGTNYAEKVTASTVTTNRVTSLELRAQDASTNFVAFVSNTANSDEPATNNTLFVDYEIDTFVPPLPRDGVEYIWNFLDGLFSIMMQATTLQELEHLLMLHYGEDPEFDRLLLNFFNDNLESVNRLLRSHQAPARFGGKRGENYIQITPSLTFDVDENLVDIIDCRNSSASYGVYYTVYPRTFVCFPEIDDDVPIYNAAEEETGTRSVTNYVALGQANREGGIYRMWVNPVVALEGLDDRHPDDDRVGHVFLDDMVEAGCIVDEALLRRSQDLDFLPAEWTTVGVRYVRDPRRNAWDEQWEWVTTGDSPKKVMRYDGEMRDAIDLKNYSPFVKELPFIHFNAPFNTIGEIGHVYVPYNNPAHELLAYDTVTFSTRSGAALLDIFTVAPAIGPKYGLVQANTLLEPVVKTLLSGVQIGWTDEASEMNPMLKDAMTDFSPLSDLYTNAVTLAPFGMGWRSFADMMPMLLSFDKFPSIASQERLGLDEKRDELEKELKASNHLLHDYMEDIARGLIDKVSFRQNIYMVVIAAQTLSPLSTVTRPVVLADQRALVTIIRDAWSGRWVIHSWRWLTE